MTAFLCFGKLRIHDYLQMPKSFFQGKKLSAVVHRDAGTSTYLP